MLIPRTKLSPDCRAYAEAGAVATDKRHDTTTTRDVLVFINQTELVNKLLLYLVVISKLI